VDRLGPKGRRGLDDGAAAPTVEIQQPGLELGGGLVLARLAWHHHGKAVPLAAQNRGGDGPRWLQLIGAEGATEHIAAKELDIGHGASQLCGPA